MYKVTKKRFTKVNRYKGGYILHLFIFTLMICIGNRNICQDFKSSLKEGVTKQVVISVKLRSRNHVIMQISWFLNFYQSRPSDSCSHPNLWKNPQFWKISKSDQIWLISRFVYRIEQWLFQVIINFCSKVLICSHGGWHTVDLQVDIRMF